MNIPSFDFNILFSFIVNPSNIKTWAILRILFIAISFYFIISIFYFISKTHYAQWRFGESLVEGLTRKQYGVKKIDKTWNSIMDKLKAGSEADFKLAVIEADSILDEVLKKIGYGGEGLEARLKQLSPIHYPNLVKMQEIHRIRNDIVRDPDYKLNAHETKKILSDYRKILDDLEVF